MQRNSPSRPDPRFQQGLSLFQHGHAERAERVLLDLLENQPRNSAALHLVGLIAAQRNDLTQAVRRFDAAIEADPHLAAPYCNRGLALQRMGNWGAALASFDRAIASKPDYAMAYFNRGIALTALDDIEAALASYDRATALDPSMNFAWYNKGVLLERREAWDLALESYERAIRIRPDDVDAHFGRGRVQQALMQWTAALASYDAAIRIKPDFVGAHNNRGVVLDKLRRFGDALASFDAAIAHKADYAMAHSNRAQTLMSLGRWDDALRACDRALEFEPKLVAAHIDRAKVLTEHEDWESALMTIDRALAIRPAHSLAHSARGFVLASIGRLDEALASYDQALSSDPANADAHLNKASLLLLTGRYEEGWQEYEWRWKCESVAAIAARRRFAKPQWTGDESIEGKTLLIHCEQGIGDTLQFCRYVALTAERGARVLFAVQEPVATLLADVKGVSELIARGDPIPAFDFHCPLLSLPRAFKTTLSTIPAPVRYLPTQAHRLAAFQAKLGDRGLPRIGLVWSGNPANSKDRSRSARLATLLKTLPHGFDYVILQKEISALDQPALESRSDVRQFCEDLHDFSDTAALCDCLDLVISVDTSVAHLAGGLGKKLWVLLSSDADWRWLLERDDSPWYPTAKLYRQMVRGDWNAVLDRVAADLVKEFNV